MKDIVKQIIEDEGYRRTVYKDSLGKLTIGYGFLIDSLELDRDVCDIIIQRKIGKIIFKLLKRFAWFHDAPQVVKEVVINMSYQLGIDGFAKFKKTIEYIENGEYKKAADEMLDSVWASEKQTPERAKKLSNKLREL